MFTFINSTIGAAIAVSRLRDRVRMMQTLRGGNVVPVVKLDSGPMDTRFGRKIRPEFTVESWVQLGGSGGVVEAPKTLQLTHSSGVHPVQEPTLKEAIADEIQY